MLRDPVQISVVIPTYNGHGRLRETIRSVLDQSHPAHEIVVVDDGSTDTTPEIEQEFAGAIRYVRCVNGGQQRARNIGVSHSTGNWIALLDHDDLYDTGYLAEVAELVAANDVGITLCNSRTWQDAPGGGYWSDDHRFTRYAPAGYWQRVGADPADRWSILDRYDFASYLAFHPSQTSMVTLSRALWDRLGGFNPTMRGNGAENFEFEIRALRMARCGLIWTPLVKMVRHDANASLDGSKMAMDVVDCLALALAEHDLNATERAIVEAELQRRLPFAIGGAYTLQDYAALRRYRQRLRGPLDWKGEVKAMIAALPEPLARPIGRLVRS